MRERIGSWGARAASGAGVAALLAMLLPAAARAANVRLMSKGLPYSTSFAGGFLDNPYTVSGDGCRIVYTSFSSQIVAGQSDGNGVSDVFLFDRCAGKKFLVSHVGDEKTTGNKDSFFPKISRDGKIVAFSSLATDLVSTDPGADQNNGEDIFVYEVASAKVFLVTGALGDPAKTGDKPSGVNGDYVLGADGRFIAFSSEASDLSPDFADGNGVLDVYWKDWAAPAIKLASHVKGNPDKPGDGRSEKPSLSRDGATVAFQSNASDLLGDPGNDAPGSDIFVWGGGDAVLVSRAAGSDTKSVGSSTNPVISGNQDYVAFESTEKADAFDPAWGDGNGQSDLFLFRTLDQTLTLVSHRAGSPDVTAGGESVLSWSGVALPALSDPGGFLAYTSTAPDLAAGQSADDRGPVGPDFEDSDVFLYDLSKNGSDLVSTSFPGAPKEADGYSYAPVVSVASLGRPSVAYVSVARDLVSGQVDANDPFVGDYFLWDNGENALVSHTDGNLSTTAAASSTISTVALSADAKFVGFGDDAPDVVLGDTNAEIDTFAYEAATKKNQLVSEGETTVIDAGANNISSPTFDPEPYARSSVSADGKLVAFVSFATNLLTGQVDGNGLGSDVFLYDRSADKVVALVSHALGAPLAGGNGASDEAVISRDGAFVAFRSGATNLVTGTDTNGGGDIFVYEVAAGTVTLVSHAAGLPSTASDGASSRPVLSADAKLLAFVSTSSNLVAGQSDVGGDQDVFRWDRVNNLSELVSHAAASVLLGASGLSFEPAISPNGRYVAYTSQATNILSPQVDAAATNDVFLWDDFDKQNRLVSHQAMPVVSLNTAANGASDRASVVENTSSGSAYVAFRSRATNVVQSQVDTNGSAGDIVLWHNNEKRLVSKQPGLPATTANGESDQPLLSDDNKFIAFQTRATNIGQGVIDINGGGWDVYVADRAAIEASASTANRLVSHQAGNPLGTANSDSLNPSIDGKGDFVAYESTSSNLVAGQSSLGGRNLFLWQRGGNVSALLSHKLGDGRTTGNNSPSRNSMLAAGAPVAAFSSYASDLVASDLNGSVLDAFVAEGVFTDLQITKTSSPVATPGAPFTYTIVAENLGPENSPGSTVTDDLPFPLDNPPTYTATWTCVGSGGGTCGSVSGASDINETVDLPAGGKVTFTVVGTLALAPESGNLVNTATITGPVADPDVSNNTSTDTDVLTPIANLNLTLTDSPDPVPTGAPLTYVATLTSTGPSNANSLTLSVALPPTAVFQSFSSPVPGCSFGASTLTCAFGDVGPGLSIPVTISMTAPSTAGTINASADGASLDSTPVSANATTEVIAPGSAIIDIATVTSKNLENTIEWLTPPAATGYGATVIRYSTSGFPASVLDGSPLLGFTEPGPDAKGTATHNVIDNGVHYYSLFVDKGGTFSLPKQVSGRTFENGTGFPEEPVQWAFTMGFSSVTAPTVGTNAIMTVSNDRGVYAMQRGGGATSGLWPATYWPLKLQGIAQNRSPVVNTTVGSAGRVLFVGAQDGRVYAIDADAGGSGGAGPLWTSGLLGATSPQVQAAPAGIFSAFGSGLGEDIILIGSRDPTATSNLFYGLKAKQPLGGNGLWLFNPGGASPMGIVSGGGTVDYPTKRVWFGSRQKSGGPTLWCLQFDEASVTSCGGGWPITDPNGFDQSPVLRGGKIYIGNNLSDVFCFDAASGASCGSSAGFDLVPDGPVKGFVFPDRLSGDLYATSTNRVWAWTDTGAAILPKAGWPGAGLTGVPNPSIPLFVRLGATAYVFVGASNGRLYQIEANNPANIKSILLGGGGAVIGAPSVDLANSLVMVGSDSGVIYALKVPLL